MDRTKEREKLIDLIVNAKRADPETGSFIEFLADFLLGYGVIISIDDSTDRLRKLIEADREGRCVVLDEPMRPMVYKPNDTDVYCPNCGETLSGKWPLSDTDDLRKLCQCPNCGQSIDDNKCEMLPELAAQRGEQSGGVH